LRDVHILSNDDKRSARMAVRYLTADQTYDHRQFKGAFSTKNKKKFKKYINTYVGLCTCVCAYASIIWTYTRVL